MRCEFCQGKGLVYRLRLADDFWFNHDPETKLRPEALPCTECGGSGVVSCCEGSERNGQLPN